MAKYLDSVGLSKAFDLIKGSIANKQDTLVSGTNIKTINNTSLLGSGNISISGDSGGGLSVDDVYPVGSIYMSVNSTNPSTLFGGTWQQLEDTFLLGAGSSYSVNHVNDSTPTIDGGTTTHHHSTPTHKLTEAETPVHAHTHGMTQPEFTLSHAHKLPNSMVVYNAKGAQNLVISGNGTKTSLNNASGAGLSTLGASNESCSRSKDAAVNERIYPSGEDASTVAAHGHGDTDDSNNMPPYMVVYIWKRTA